MEFDFEDQVWFWRGPSPWHFVTVPEDACDVLQAESTFVSYGWGMIPVVVRIGDSVWSTALWPKDGRYIVPIKSSVRRAEGLDVGDTAAVHLSVGSS